MVVPLLIPEPSREELECFHFGLALLGDAVLEHAPDPQNHAAPQSEAPTKVIPFLGCRNVTGAHLLQALWVEEPSNGSMLSWEQQMERRAAALREAETGDTEPAGRPTRPGKSAGAAASWLPFNAACSAVCCAARSESRRRRAHSNSLFRSMALKPLQLPVGHICEDSTGTRHWRYLGHLRNSGFVSRESQATQLEVGIGVELGQRRHLFRSLS